MYHLSYTGPKIWNRLLIFVLILLAGCRSGGYTKDMTGNANAKSDCYKVELLDYRWISEVATTWHYRVGQPDCTQPVSSWMLELPACAAVAEASPSDWDVASPDLNYQMNGIKWQSGSRLQNGEFSITLLGDLVEGDTRAGVEAQDLVIDDVRGPACKDLARLPSHVPTMPVSMANGPTATVKVQSAYCRAMPMGKAQKVTLIYRGQEAQIMGRNADPNNPWWYIKIPNQEENCWLWGKTVTTTGDLESVPILNK